MDHGNGETEPAAVNLPLVQGDRVRTMLRSRVDVMFPDGASITIDADSEVEFLGPARVRVLSGSIEHHAAVPPDPRSNSAQNLPPDLQPYTPDLDQNGSWQYDAQYGNVWYPTSVAADWRPYYNGYWATVPTYGYTWIGYDRWAWPTHHYGRWGYAQSRWFWIPGRTYASAWVSWGTAPGYVSWCPLGWDGRAVVGLSAGLHSSWNAWTVVRREHFGGHAYSARRYGVEPYRVASSAAFIEHRTPPARDRRGSFSVAPSRDASVDTSAPEAGRRGRDGSDSASPAGVAVPRGAGEGRWRERAPSTTTVTPHAAQPVTPVVVLPSDQQRGTGRPDDGGQQRGNPGDHPAYRPRYTPRYDAAPETPRAEPRERAQPRHVDSGQPEAPNATGSQRGNSGGDRGTPNSDRGNSGGGRGSANGDRGAAPARERSPDSATTGTAVRRPR